MVWSKKEAEKEEWKERDVEREKEMPASQVLRSMKPAIGQISWFQF